jgi:hypothetical protein
VASTCAIPAWGCPDSKVSTFVVPCPDGTVPIGGGFRLPSAGDQLAVKSSFLITGKWVVHVENFGPATTFEVTAVCAAVS